MRTCRRLGGITGGAAPRKKVLVKHKHIHMGLGLGVSTYLIFFRLVFALLLPPIDGDLHLLVRLIRVSVVPFVLGGVIPACVVLFFLCASPRICIIPTTFK